MVFTVSAMHNFRVFRIGTLAFALATLSACGGLVPSGGSASRTTSAPHDKPAVASQAPRLPSTAPQFSPREEDRVCLIGLSDSGARFSSVPDSYEGPGCAKLGTVQLSSLTGDRSQFAVSNIGPVQCQTAQTFSDWARYGVDRAARQILGSPLDRIETMGSYSCRNVAGSNRKSAHATAGAIDIGAFILADGRRISVRDHWSEGTREEREFLRTVHRSACKRFGTVLGPDYNADHHDHLHLEGSGAEFCR